MNLGIIQHATDGARAGRYVHLVAAMFLPAIALAADAVIRRWRLLAPAVAVALLIGFPGNIAAIEQTGVERFRLGQPKLVLALPRSPYARQVPRSFRPLGVGGPEVTMGWLLDGVDSARLPDPHITASRRRPCRCGSRCNNPEQRRRPSNVCSSTCRFPVVCLGARSLRFAAADVQIELQEGGAFSEPIVFDPTRGERLQAIAGPLHLRIGPTGRGDPPTLCG